MKLDKIRCCCFVVNDSDNDDDAVAADNDDNTDEVFVLSSADVICPLKHTVN